MASQRPIRVGFVVHVMQVAGAEVLVRETIARLGPAIVPTVFCLDSVGKIGEDLLARGVDVIALGRRPGWDFGVSRKLAAAATERQIEVLHAHQYSPFFYAALAKAMMMVPWPWGRQPLPLPPPRNGEGEKAPGLAPLSASGRGGGEGLPSPRLILTEHGRHFPDVVSPPRRAVNRLVLDRFADRVNACCAFSAKALCRNDGFAGNRIEVIENGIEVDRYGPATDRPALMRRLGLDPTRRYVVHVARHHPVKDQPTLIRGFAGVAAEFPDVDLLLVGDGPLRPDLERLVAELGVADRVNFMGIRSDVADVLRAADVFGLTSVSEAASLTLLEAMATGLPVAVTAVGGNPEIVRDGVDGLLFPRGDAGGCTAALRKLLADPAYAKSLGASGRKRVRERYRLEQTVEAYHRLYRELAR